MFDVVLINSGEMGYETDNGYMEFMNSTEFDEMVNAYNSETYN